MVNGLTETFPPGSPLRLSLKATENSAKSDYLKQAMEKIPAPATLTCKRGRQRSPPNYSETCPQ